MPYQWYWLPRHQPLGHLFFKRLQLPTNSWLSLFTLFRLKELARASGPRGRFKWATSSTGSPLIDGHIALPGAIGSFQDQTKSVPNFQVASRHGPQQAGDCLGNFSLGNRTAPLAAAHPFAQSAVLPSLGLLRWFVPDKVVVSFSFVNRVAEGCINATPQPSPHRTCRFPASGAPKFRTTSFVQVVSAAKSLASLSTVEYL